MILGIDIGGTTVKVGVVVNSKIVKSYTIPTRPKTLIDDLIASFKEQEINFDELHAIGCAVPGFIDHKKGIITLSGNMGYKNYAFKEDFESKLGKSVYVVNDANAAALGEYWVGAGKDYDSTILYTLGTGVGGGIIVNNKLVFGSHGYAGELGHGGKFQEERKCNCGMVGCIEPSSSAVGIEQSILEVTGEKKSVKDVAESFKNGDPKIVQAFEKSLRPLAMHIATMQTALNPECIIIGGGPSNIGKPLADFIYKLIADYQLDFIHNSTPILIATTRNNAGMLGAAYWALTEKSDEESSK